MKDKSIVSSKLNELRKKRRENVNKSKSFLPSFFVTIILWFSLVSLILFVKPAQEFALELFFVNLFLVFLFTFSLLFANTRRGFLVAVFIVSHTFFRYLGIASPLNSILLGGALIMFEIYFTKRN